LVGTGSGEVEEHPNLRCAGVDEVLAGLFQLVHDAPVALTQRPRTPKSANARSLDAFDACSDVFEAELHD
jgi:hypothetical protein